MPEDIFALINSGGSTASAGKSGVTSSTTKQKRSDMPTNPLMEALTKRLLQQGSGISSSSSSALQSEIAAAMKDTQAAGEASSARIQSEREREMSFARDRAGATYTGALEGRTGYATQVSALRELTDTTEKSVRDLDQRYQEALLANDANTASQMAGLRMEKLKFQQEQEQNFFTNVMSVANLQQSAIDSMMRREEFWSNQEQQQNQFVMEMANSKYQFEKNLGLQYKELGLKEQEIAIAWDRNEISRQEMNARKNELEKEKAKTAVMGTVFSDLRKEIISGSKKNGTELDPSAYAEWAASNPQYKAMHPNATYEDYFATALLAKDELVAQPLVYQPPVSTRTNTGLLPTFGRAAGDKASSFSTFMGDIFWSGKENKSSW